MNDVLDFMEKEAAALAVPAAIGGVLGGGSAYHLAKGVEDPAETAEARRKRIREQVALATVLATTTGLGVGQLYSALKKEDPTVMSEIGRYLKGGLGVGIGAGLGGHVIPKSIPALASVLDDKKQPIAKSLFSTLGDYTAGPHIKSEDLRRSLAALSDDIGVAKNDRLSSRGLQQLRAALKSPSDEGMRRAVSSIMEEANPRLLSALADGTEDIYDTSLFGDALDGRMNVGYKLRGPSSSQSDKALRSGINTLGRKFDTNAALNDPEYFNRLRSSAEAAFNVPNFEHFQSNQHKDIRLARILDKITTGHTNGGVVDTGEVNNILRNMLSNGELSNYYEDDFRAALDKLDARGNNAMALDAYKNHIRQIGQKARPTTGMQDSFSQANRSRADFHNSLGKIESLVQKSRGDKNPQKLLDEASALYSKSRNKHVFGKLDDMAMRSAMGGFSPAELDQLVQHSSGNASGFDRLGKMLRRTGQKDNIGSLERVFRNIGKGVNPAKKPSGFGGKTKSLAENIFGALQSQHARNKAPGKLLTPNLSRATKLKGLSRTAIPLAGAAGGAYFMGKLLGDR